MKLVINDLSERVSMLENTSRNPAQHAVIRNERVATVTDVSYYHSNLNDGNDGFYENKRPRYDNLSR